MSGIGGAVVDVLAAVGLVGEAAAPVAAPLGGAVVRGRRVGGVGGCAGLGHADDAEDSGERCEGGALAVAGGEDVVAFGAVEVDLVGGDVLVAAVGVGDEVLGHGAGLSWVQVLSARRTPSSRVTTGW